MGGSQRKVIMAGEGDRVGEGIASSDPFFNRCESGLSPLALGGGGRVQRKLLR